MFNNYGPLATEVYQLTKPVGTTLNGDIAYYLSRLEQLEGPILEAGVGTGRMLIPLLQLGLTVEGIDNSSEMLRQCKQNCHAHNLTTTLHHGDLADFQFPRQYAAIIIPTSTFCLIDNEAKALKVLRNLHRHLLPGGRLILDLDMPFYPELGDVTTETYPLSETEGITLETKTIEIDWIQQHVIRYLKYDRWEDGRLVASELQQLLLRWYGLSEFKLLLTALGFKAITVSSDYEFGVEPTDSNQTITFEAIKAQ